MAMLELTCWACTWIGSISARFAGLQVACKCCRAVNPAPEPVTDEVFVADWLAAIDPATESDTVEVDTREDGPLRRFDATPIAS
jgi:hypothetical protein